MGSGSYSGSDFSKYAKKSGYDSKTTESIYASRLRSSVDPLKFDIRESRDSEEHPNSIAIIIALDVTGSMGSVLDSMIRGGLNTLMEEIYNRSTITDPQVMFMGIGDVECDNAPIQATQFESDIRIVQQMEDICFEKGGGGNSYESYSAAWYFAAHKTSIDCFEKRGQKGFLFTIGDELPTGILKASDISRFIGDSPQLDYSSEDLYKIVCDMYTPYHLIIEAGNYCQHVGFEKVRSEWASIMGQNAIRVNNISNIGEIITSLIEVSCGKDVSEVVGSWSGSTALSVKAAIGDLTSTSSGTGVTRL